MKNLLESPNTSKIILDYIQNKSSDIFLILDNFGKIIYANNRAISLFGDNFFEGNIKDYIIDFFNSYSIEDLKGEKKLNVNTKKELPETIDFQFFIIKDKIYAIGELCVEQNLSLKNEMFKINQEYSSLNRELIKNEVELKKVNELKNQFLGMAAHDLRNPIGNIYTISNILLTEYCEKNNEDLKELLNVVNRSSQFMLKLINDLLDYSSIESGKLVLDLEKQNFYNFIVDVVHTNQYYANKKNIKIELDVDENLGQVEFDIWKMQQVLNNLISNAIKFSFRGSRIIVRVIIENQLIKIAVIDEGQGILEEELDIIFNPFTKTSTKSTENERSTGLGLAITQKIIKAHKGKIWVQNNTTKGTTFYFVIPLFQNS